MKSSWLQEQGVGAFIFDTTVLYSGGRRNGTDALRTAVEHGFTEDYLGCPVVIADGLSMPVGVAFRDGDLYVSAV